MIYVVGDTHIPHDIKKLTTKKFPEQKNMTKNDVIIQLGDFGGYWYSPDNKKYKSNLYWRKWLAEKTFQFVFVDGNHENFDLIDKLPKMEKYGAPVHYEDFGKGNFIYHLIRGNVYTINDKKFFVMGGAQSTDRESRIEFVDYWKREIPSYSEMDYAIENLEIHDFDVDYVLTHTCPAKVGFDLLHREGMYGSSVCYDKIMDPTVNFFQHLVEDRKLKFKEWHFGHFHQDKNVQMMGRDFLCHYNEIMELK